MKKHDHVIRAIEPGSIAEELELAPGDRLLAINDQEIRDIFDYHYLINDDYLVLLVEKADGEEWELEIEKDYAEDLGITFENGLMDDYRSCSNKCIFCFIDQLPKGMRDTLYFKDDDSRLSFLQGNYVTLTNMSDEDVERIIRYKLMPINVSVHTTNPELRCMMLHNRFAGEALKKLERLYEAGVEMNGQIVLCKGVNDGKELIRTIEELSGYLPFMQSLSVVPVGLSKHREGLYPLKPFEKADAKEVLAIIRAQQDRCTAKWGKRFVHAGDEWYFLAEEPFPEASDYDGYPQLENGVGMVRLLLDEFHQALSGEQGDEGTGSCTVVTGLLMAQVLQGLIDEFQALFPNRRIRLAPIRNDFFGERITVSGLLTGRDIIAQLKGTDLGERLLLPENLLRFGEDVLLDDVTTTDLEKALQVRVDIVKSSGFDLIRAFKG